jgi:hypothetical protein
VDLGALLPALKSDLPLLLQARVPVLDLLLPELRLAAAAASRQLNVQLALVREAGDVRVVKLQRLSHRVVGVELDEGTALRVAVALRQHAQLLHRVVADEVKERAHVLRRRLEGDVAHEQDEALCLAVLTLTPSARAVALLALAVTTRLLTVIVVIVIVTAAVVVTAAVAVVVVVVIVTNAFLLSRDTAALTVLLFVVIVTVILAFTVIPFFIINIFSARGRVVVVVVVVAVVSVACSIATRGILLRVGVSGGGRGR